MHKLRKIWSKQDEHNKNNHNNKRFSFFPSPAVSASEQTIAQKRINEKLRPFSTPHALSSTPCLLSPSLSDVTHDEKQKKVMMTARHDNKDNVNINLDEEDQNLQLGMYYHEHGELEKATQYWRLSAEQNSPLGLFFYGIALRHGWGCRQDAVAAVMHLQKAAECAVHDLEMGIASSTKVAKSELVLAIHELGVCFRHGWGVPKNAEMAVYYFQIAANLGDADAQNDLAFCYERGIGVKKDIFKAAKYYRMAIKQGRGLVGNSWVMKEKYADTS
ncbi:hypothetical protein EC973_005656 [Apophysomyces ossiformis]|uniref:Uncharacterized protein n=1 Tax=Apophysomyces ossiformis TaxID=679940 RepID=A0A8H7BH62_9FUNG|nr:hypothetical protein EC973_005656 [Apophysomyces ossiformis]